MVRFTTPILIVLLGLQAGASPAGGWQREISSRGCTANSFANTTSFILKEYKIETVTYELDGNLGGGTTQYRATLAVENPGTGDVYRLDRMPVAIGGGTWSVCRSSSDAPLPSTLARCQYLLERRQGGRIGFRFQWYCDDEVPGKLILFDATVIGDLPAEVCVAGDGTDGVTQSCSLAVDGGQLSLEVANISWEPATTD